MLRLLFSTPVSSLKVPTAALAALLGIAGSLTPVGAHESAVTQRAPVRFNGQVIRVVGPVENPTGFRLQLPARVVDFEISPTATFTAESAEANVEGFVKGDYALVFANRVRRAWIATRILFDVDPIGGPVQVRVTGTITRVTPNQKRFVLKLDSGELRLVTVVPKTTFLMNDQPVTAPPVLAKDDLVTVVMRRTPRGWFAVSVDLLTG